MSLKAKSRAAIEAFFAIPPEARYHEVIDGELLKKAMPSPRHAHSQSNIVTRIGPRFGGRGGAHSLVRADQTAVLHRGRAHLP